MKHDINAGLSRSEYEKLIDEWIFRIRDRAILKRRLLDGITFERLAEEFEMSTKGIQKIVYKSLDELVKHL